MNTNEQKIIIAQALGEEPESIRALNPKWSQLLKEGVLVSLSIGRWRAKAQLNWSDLGLDLAGEEDKDFLDIINLGHKRLLPAQTIKELDAIESKARKWLDRNAFRVYWGYFIPATNYGEWKAKNEEYRAEYMAKMETLLANYDATIERLLVSYAGLAGSNFRRLKQLYPDKLKIYTDEAVFANDFVRRIQAHIPEAKAVRASFYYGVSLQYIPLISALADDQRAADVSAAAGAAAWAEADAKIQVAKTWQQAEEDKAEAERRAAWNAAQWKEKLMKEMHEDVISQAKTQKEEMIDGFLRDILAQLRGMIYDASIDILGAIQKNGSLPARSVVQLQNLVSQIGSLNFYGDQEIDAMLAPIKSILTTDSKDRSVAEIDRNLRNIAIVCRASLIGLGTTPRAARGFISDKPTARQLDRARRGLGLSEPEAMPVERLERIL